jgi:hypothetical protein
MRTLFSAASSAWHTDLSKPSRRLQTTVETRASVSISFTAAS